MMDVAVLTNSIAVTNAAANEVAVARLGSKIVVIWSVPFVWVARNWAPATINAGTVPI